MGIKVETMSASEASAKFCLSFTHNGVQLVNADVIAEQADREAERCWRDWMCKLFNLDARLVEAHAKKYGAEACERELRRGGHGLFKAVAL